MHTYHIDTQKYNLFPLISISIDSPVDKFGIGLINSDTKGFP